MSDVKISVIMPVYKVEKYVRKAIESIQNQTLKEFEFLIIDDGTQIIVVKFAMNMPKKMLESM